MKPPKLSPQMLEMVTRRVVNPCLQDIACGFSVPAIIEQAYIQGMYDTVQVYIVKPPAA